MGRPFHRHQSGLHLQASLSLLAKVFGFATVIAGLVATIQRDLTLLILAGVLLFVFAIMAFVQLVEGNRITCAVCRAALFGSFRCHKHHGARKIMGSYTIPVACDILILGRYQCPHCNERVICRGEEETLDPQRAKPIPTAPQSLPTMRQSAIAAMRQRSAQETQAQQARENLTQPDDSPTLPA